MNFVEIDAGMNVLQVIINVLQKGIDAIFFIDGDILYSRNIGAVGDLFVKCIFCITLLCPECYSLI